MNKQKNVTVYGNRTCAYCGAARMLLAKKAIEFDDIVITDDPSKQEEMIRKSGNRTVPQIFIDEAPIGGFDELCALDKSGELDTLLTGEPGEQQR